MQEKAYIPFGWSTLLNLTLFLSVLRHAVNTLESSVEVQEMELVIYYAMLVFGEA